jgi:hypothetical protein
MRWVEDEASRRWYVVEDDGSTRWPTPQEESQRLAEAAARESSAARAAQAGPGALPAFSQQAYPGTAGSTGSRAAGPSPFPVSAAAVGDRGRASGRAARRANPLVPVGTGVLGLVVGLVGGFALGSAGDGPDAVTPVAGAAASASPSAGDDASAEPAAQESDAPRDTSNPRFGDDVAFDDGTRLTCARPVAFQRDRFAAGGEGRRVFLKVKCTFRNSSGSTFEPIGTTVAMSAGGEEGDQVFQEDLDLPTNPVLDGRSVTWWSGFGVASKKDVQVSVDVGFLDYDTVTFS